MLTPKEAAALQSFPKSFKTVSDNQAYKQFQNAVPVRLVEAIALEIAKVIN